ncbi:hypothetical protein AQ946_05645 [Burkholderia pseudomallei]|nr:hypothetical protein AQ766_27340 [Burkholderia pseudomallei]ONE15043.1 hypothetical protein AQ946_05645 [Burkholderia pseudomallei]ONE40761.1 hypothetical protein AQ948_12555 [Burkholderia pseudomallei]ONE41897.1 hypothetical protein AQ947_09970 [Burkholderia pseudomallei]
MQEQLDLVGRLAPAAFCIIALAFVGDGIVVQGLVGQPLLPFRRGKQITPAIEGSMESLWR